jgi:hypothetical protein
MQVEQAKSDGHRRSGAKGQRSIREEWDVRAPVQMGIKNGRPHNIDTTDFGYIWLG